MDTRMLLLLGLIFIELVVGAGILGITIAVMEEGEFPGWVRMIGCVLLAVLSATLVNAFLPPGFFLVGLAVGAVCAGIAISAMCGMSVKRATIAASIYLAFQTCLMLLLRMML